MRKRRAIIFDDEKIILQLLKYVFSAMNYEVITYSEPVACPLYTGTATACTKEHPCADILITDFRFSKMSGLDLIKQQSQQGCKLTTRNKAVMSGYLDETNMGLVKDLGCTFFSKPIELGELTTWLSLCENRMDLSRPLATRRNYLRYEDQREIRCTIDRGETIINGATVNISDSGLCLKVPTNLETGQLVRFDNESSLAAGSASVRWVSDQGNGSFLAGLRFIDSALYSS